MNNSMGVKGWVCPIVHAFIYLYVEIERDIC